MNRYLEGNSFGSKAKIKHVGSYSLVWAEKNKNKKTEKHEFWLFLHAFSLINVFFVFF